MADSNSQSPPIPPLSRPLGRRVAVGFLLTMMILVIVGYFVSSGIRGLIDQGNQVVHTHEVLATLQHLQTDILEVQSAARNYVITDRTEFLADFHVFGSQVSKNCERLRQMMADNPSQLERLDRLESLFIERIQVASGTIETYLRQGAAVSQEEIRSGKGDKISNDIRNLTAEMEGVEQDLLAGRQRASRQAVQSTMLASGASLLAVFLILLFVFWLIRREARCREATETSLQLARDRLEASLRNSQRLSEDIAVVAAMGDYLQACRSDREAYAVLTRIVPRLLPGVAGAVSITCNSRNHVETVFTWGETDGFQADFAPEECWGLRRGRTHHVADHEGCDPVCNHLTGIGTGYLCTPMMIHGETLGVLTIRAAAGNRIGEAEVRAARAVAEQISLSLANLRLQEALRVQSIRDPMTGLFNRRYLEESLEREVNRAKRQNQTVAVVMIDVDHFKRFNDMHGHEGGDLLLSEFGKMLAREVRAEDIPCRYGGEEFCLVMPGADLNAARNRAETIREAATKLVAFCRQKPLGSITLSAGVAIFPTHGSSGESVVAAADAALYRAKRNGRNQVVIAGFTEPTAIPEPPLATVATADSARPRECATA